jgi:hypothetical protein
VTPLHMGPLHGMEGLLVLLLAFGPLLAVVPVVLMIRHRDLRDERAEAAAGPCATPDHRTT